ncbi:MAG: hypothetical protein RLZZ141_2148 [Pseudomonadota bacterium]
MMGRKPPTPAAPVLPPEGEDPRTENLPPLGEVARSAEGGLVSYPRTSFLTRVTARSRLRRER